MKSIDNLFHLHDNFQILATFTPLQNFLSAINLIDQLTKIPTS